MKILFVGDVIGRGGRRTLQANLAEVQEEKGIDFTVVNVENAAGGFGVTDGVIEEFRDLSIDVYTTGNHIWDKKEFVERLGDYPHVIRPANYPDGNPGTGSITRATATGIEITVIQVMGQVFMPPCENPFRALDRELSTAKSKVILVDAHCEASSEKQALGFYLDGRVSAVLGTHTHVPTADERILPGGTAFQTDVGMTGAYESIIGFRPEEILHRFLYNTPSKFVVAKRDARLVGALVDVDEATGQARSIRRVEERLDD